MPALLYTQQHSVSDALLSHHSCIRARIIKLLEWGSKFLPIQSEKSTIFSISWIVTHKVNTPQGLRYISVCPKEKKRKEKKSFIENITQDIEFTLISKSPVYIQRIESVLELLLRREQGVDWDITALQRSRMENVLFSGESQLTNKTKRSKYYTIMYL